MVDQPVPRLPPPHKKLITLLLFVRLSWLGVRPGMGWGGAKDEARARRYGERGTVYLKGHEVPPSKTCVCVCVCVGCGPIDLACACVCAVIKLPNPPLYGFRKLHF